MTTASGPSASRLGGAEGVPTGNTYDKYGSGNPVVARLMRRFRRDLDDLFERAAPASVLDVGCGEGVLTEAWAQRLGDRRVVGVDLEDAGLRAHWSARTRPNLEFAPIDGNGLPFSLGEFDLVAAIEVLEHVPDPELMLSEMSRCAARHLLVSVPREPLWRALNLARGAYLPRLGNTPGHLNHWSKRAFERLAARHGEVVAVRSPLPWTMLLVRR